MLQVILGLISEMETPVEAICYNKLVRIRKTPVSAIHFISCPICKMGIGATTPSGCMDAFDEHFNTFHLPPIEISGDWTYTALINV